MLALAQRLPKDRYKVDFLTLSEPGPYAVDAEAFGSRVFSLGSSPPPDITPVGPVDPPHPQGPALPVDRAQRALRHHRRLDVPDLPPRGAHAAGSPGPRVVMSGRRDLRGTAQPLGAAGRAIETVARRMTDLVVANSHAVEADTIAREHPKPGHLRVIYNGVEPVPALSPEERDGAPPRVGRRAGRRARRRRRQLPRGEAARRPRRRVRGRRGDAARPAADPDRRGSDASEPRGPGRVARDRGAGAAPRGGGRPPAAVHRVRHRRPFVA